MKYTNGKKADPSSFPFIPTEGMMRSAYIMANAQRFSDVEDDEEQMLRIKGEIMDEFKGMTKKEQRTNYFSTKNTF